MADTVNIVVRLHLPEGRPGEVIAVGSDRAATLIDLGYATAAPGEAIPETVITQGPEPAAPPAAPQVELPSVGDLKEEWARTADSLGIDHSDMTKAEIIEAVTAAVGEPEEEPDYEPEDDG